MLRGSSSWGYGLSIHFVVWPLECRFTTSNAGFVACPFDFGLGTLNPRFFVRTRHLGFGTLNTCFVA